MAKKAICLIFTFLLSINSFAAIVSDSDGSAFVTKTEFDALKNDFKDQIDNYNLSIDAKIDGAIASYLASIKKSTKKEINFKLDQKVWTPINSVKQVDGAIGLYGVANLYAPTDSVRTSTNIGLVGYYQIEYKPTKAKGILLDTQYNTSSGELGKNGILRGYGERQDFSVNQNNMQVPTRNQNPGRIVNRTMGFQLNWWDVQFTDEGYKLPTEKTYYANQVTGAYPGPFGPICFGVEPTVTTTWLGPSNKLSRKLYTVKSKVLDTDLYLVNDEEVTTCIDYAHGNGFSIIPQTNTYKDYLVTDISLTGRLNAFYNNQDSIYNMSGTSLPIRRLRDAGWSGTNYYDAYTTNLGLNTQELNWKNGNAFNGYNRLLYVSHIDKPRKLFTDILSDDDDFFEWVKNINNAPTDAWQEKNIGGARQKHFNIRYGIPIIQEFDKNAKYTLTLKNNDKENDIKVKVFNKLKTTKFADVDGLKTSESNKDDKNSVKVPKDSTITFEFKVENDNSPIFIKCSDNASITLISANQETGGE